jgi:hypothetical protein
MQNPEAGRSEVYPQENDILYLLDITKVVKYSPFLLTGGIWDVP